MLAAAEAVRFAKHLVFESAVLQTVADGQQDSHNDEDLIAIRALVEVLELLVA